MTKPRATRSSRRMIRAKQPLQGSISITGLDLITVALKDFEKSLARALRQSIELALTQDLLYGAPMSLKRDIYQFMLRNSSSYTIAQLDKAYAEMMEEAAMSQPDGLTTTNKLLTARIVSDVLARYNNACAVKLEFEPGTVMAGLTIKCSIPGQSRTVLIDKKRLTTWMAKLEVYEEIRDEVLFAIFLLLDEDEDED